jgi:CheY-like chemotaxis protein
MADNGQIAVDKVKLKKYNVVLMDLHMPVLDGYSATREIRNLDDPEKKHIPIIALSASALGEIEVRARKFGMDAFVTKPFVPKVLFKTLLKFRPEV